MNYLSLIYHISLYSGCISQHIRAKREFWSPGGEGRGLCCGAGCWRRLLGVQHLGREAALLTVFKPFQGFSSLEKVGKGWKSLLKRDEKSRLEAAARSVEDCMASIKEKFGGLNGVVSCAGGQTMGCGLTVDKKGNPHALKPFQRLRKAPKAHRFPTQESDKE